MSDFNVAADAARGLAKQFRPLLALADKLDAIGSINNATVEHEARRDQARAEEQAAVADLQGVRDSIASVSGELNDWVRRAEQMRIDAHAEADGIIAAAQSEANRLVDEATVSRDAMQAEVDALQAKRGEIEQDIADLAQKRVDADAKLAAARDAMRRALEG